MKYFFTFVSALLLFVSCSSDDDKGNTPTTAQRTVVVYMSGENRLSSIAQEDINEMITGAKSLADINRFVIFVDRANKNENPFIARIDKNSTTTRIDTLYKYENDFYASSADNFYEVLKRATTLCPAKEYGLVLWGHASGWIIEQDSIETKIRRAYGVDNNKNDSSTDIGKWMNIPSMRMALEALGIKWQFIFADCCNMMCVEVGYELRNVTNYLIGSPAEIPGWGAPYDQIMSSFFLSGSNIYQGIIDNYFNFYTDYFQKNPSIDVDKVGSEQLSGYSVPLSVIETQYMEAFAQKTKDIVTNIATTYPTALDLSNMPYYLNIYAPMLYDMKAVISKYASTADYAAWKEVYKKAIPHSRVSFKWMTGDYDLYHYGFPSFYQDESQWGCISMFIPQDMTTYYTGHYAYNKTANNFEWNRIMNWSRFGWE